MSFSFFSKKVPVEKKEISVQTQISMHLKKLRNEISSLSKVTWQFNVDPNTYTVTKQPGADFAVYGGGHQYTKAIKKSDKIRFLQEASSLLTKNELTPVLINKLLQKYPHAESGMFSRTDKIIKLIKKEADAGILLDSFAGPCFSAQ